MALWNAWRTEGAIEVEKNTVQGNLASSFEVLRTDMRHAKEKALV